MCYDAVTVSGAEAGQSFSMGLYVKVDALEQGYRPVYKLFGFDRQGFIEKYLFYLPSWKIWIVGDNFTSDAAYIRSDTSEAPCPDLATGWQAWIQGRGWVTNPITVQGAKYCSFSVPPLPLPAVHLQSPHLLLGFP
jgi:hypothetical protein